MYFREESLKSTLLLAVGSGYRPSYTSWLPFGLSLLKGVDDSLKYQSPIVFSLWIYPHFWFNILISQFSWLSLILSIIMTFAFSKEQLVYLVGYRRNYSESIIFDSFTRSMLLFDSKLCVSFNVCMASVAVVLKSLWYCGSSRATGIESWKSPNLVDTVFTSFVCMFANKSSNSTLPLGLVFSLRLTFVSSAKLLAISIRLLKPFECFRACLTHV